MLDIKNVWDASASSERIPLRRRRAENMAFNSTNKLVRVLVHKQFMASCPKLIVHLVVIRADACGPRRQRCDNRQLVARNLYCVTKKSAQAMKRPFFTLTCLVTATASS